MRSFDGFLNRLEAERDYRGQIVARRTLAARAARCQAPASPLPERLAQALAKLDISELYTHQAQACDLAGAGRDLVVCTGTASGKTLCYHLPVLAALLEDPHATALYLFPAKALANDQLGGLERLIAAAGLGEAARPACFDGDTPTHQRAGIRRRANLLLSNPDMLHVSILPNAARWAPFFANLRHVVLDEIHTYRGIFGSHVAGVVRRLRRVCRHFGSDPTFICCSATLGNPRELAERLIHKPVELIDEDGSPRGARHVVLWNPPFLEDAAVTRRSGNVEAQKLMAALLEEDAGTIAFARARVVAELLYKYVADGLRERRPDLARRIRPYRGGYLPAERREIEQQLFSGALRGVCSTSALELGIDVGALDAAIVVGFPGTLCSFWQQVGRAGRRQAESLAILVAYDEPVDQYLMRNPDFLFDRPLEHATIDPENPHILAQQLACAAYELPLESSDLAEFGGLAGEVTRLMVEDGRLRHTADRYYWANSETPALQTSLRNISNASYAIVDITGGGNETIGQLDAISAPEQLYPGAIYLHQAESYLVRELDQAARVARVERFESDYYTQPMLFSECRVLQERQAALLDASTDDADIAGRRCFGDVHVQWQTIAFRKFRYYSMEQIGQTALELDPLHLDSSAVWLQPPSAVLRAVEGAGYSKFAGLNAARNLLLAALPPLAMADRFDLGGVIDSLQLGRPTIFLYDRYPGGVGYARLGYEHAERLLAIATEIIAGCPCEDGCPGCVGPPNLRPAIHHDPDLQSGDGMPSKRAGQVLLEAWLSACDGA